MLRLSGPVRPLIQLRLELLVKYVELPSQILCLVLYPFD